MRQKLQGDDPARVPPSDKQIIKAIDDHKSQRGKTAAFVFLLSWLTQFS